MCFSQCPRVDHIERKNKAPRRRGFSLSVQTSRYCCRAPLATSRNGQDEQTLSCPFHGAIISC
ncbi:DUF2043 domain-containing protein [Aeromonas hydrophila]|nr:DUF2043 domain-containing protein [Aeromonas hydrophila]